MLRGGEVGAGAPPYSDGHSSAVSMDAAAVAVLDRGGDGDGGDCGAAGGGVCRGWGDHAVVAVGDGGGGSGNEWWDGDIGAAGLCSRVELPRSCSVLGECGIDAVCLVSTGDRDGGDCG